MARGRGVGTRLLDVLLLPALDGRAWATADGEDRATLSFFRGRSRRQATAPSPGARDHVVLLAPRHPALVEENKVTAVPSADRPRP
ncbi:hypothetical protein P8605_42955 [Streptomyces sp. T-3]|nr:hypothetical protein [Streptomyces sp. T-3]